MIQLAGEFFETKSDPSQITVTRRTMRRLRKIHPSTLMEKTDKRGPIAWVAVIPTTSELMKQFIGKKIDEQTLLNKTPLGGTYDALYLCSALVLPEHRGKGLAKRLVTKAIKSIQEQHPINCLFYWAFSVAGKKLAAAVAKDFTLPLYKRKR
jgi:GNAT superfamily N-acetyltransferase